MENPEEVLQALDEFQKMRPTEIPRELEEYLCWVAKTGDPVYQWSLIKALFREKLTRVMTDFYESCPSLDLAPCPNVETFNYDTMKSSLLERLESFANAPFTVQRICELLTTPRKEYNRVDKFMRAIEKNILVVSTKEPGSAARRNENGDGLVNGSMEDDAPGADVEMDSWVKDCATSAQAMDAEARLLDDVTATATATATSPTAPPVANGDKAIDFVPSTSEFSGPSIAREVPDAIMNEDTSSQPSLDIDSPESEPVDPGRKLQTTFQAKDFITHEKSPEPYEEDTKVTEQTDADLEATNEIQSSVESSSESLEECAKSSELNERGSILPNIENFLHTRLENSVITSEGTPSQKSDSENEESTSPKEEEDDASLLPEALACQEQSSSSNSSESFSEENNIPKDKAEEIPSPKEVESEEVPMIAESVQEEVSQEVKPEESSTSDEVKEEAKETIEEAVADQKNEEDSKPEEEEKTVTPEESISEKCDVDSGSLTIEETTEDDSPSETKSIVPDPIPIVEEPKEEELPAKSADSETSIEEIDSSREADLLPTNIDDLPKNEPTIENLENNDASEKQVASLEACEETKTDVSISDEKIQVPESPVAETASEKATKPEESMEVDGEATAALDEPMEEETPQVAS
ncbi:serine/threonine-protein phosphatase 4 regulatory subunit 2 [Leptopilina heterotoma]|uniref:serine/threonine-protein phosphatase 4 regulatory subunit 2 n=1 Tax=Leptopilina heterotoma TaxID=63436 RepID=UPI001CA9A405|nr:serine/threonine-protein phosphatase 4 regulatory subunit 2 [Leptopilina heterotoma]